MKAHQFFVLLALALMFSAALGGRELTGSSSKSKSPSPPPPPYGTNIVSASACRPISLPESSLLSRLHLREARVGLPKRYSLFSPPTAAAVRGFLLSSHAYCVAVDANTTKGLFIAFWDTVTPANNKMTACQVRTPRVPLPASPLASF